MFLRQFGFMDEDFLKGAFDPLTRRSLMIELEAYRRRTMIGFCIMSVVGFLNVLLTLATGATAFVAIVLLFFSAAMFLGLTLHADAKYKLVKVVETMEKGRNGEGG